MRTVTILAGGGIASREDPDVVDALTEILTGEGVSDPEHPAAAGRTRR